MAYGMDKRHVDLLRRNRVNLVKNIVVDELFLSELMNENVLLEQKKEEIQNDSRNPTMMKKVGVLLDYIPKRGPKAFGVFLKALVDTHQDNTAFLLDSATAQQLVSRREAAENQMPQFPPRRQPQQPHPSNISTGGLPGANAMVTQTQNVPAPPSLEVSRNSPPPQRQPQPSGSFSTGSCQGRDENCDDVTDLAVPSELVNSSMMMLSVGEVDRNDAVFCNVMTNLHESYSMRRKERGRALIINNEYFAHKRLGERKGSDFDVFNLDNLLQKLHFSTTVKGNCTAKDIKDAVKEEKKKPQGDAFILFIMSHGARGIVYGVDGHPVDINTEIVDMLDGNHFPEMKEKPKMIFIQACQGEQAKLDSVDSGGGDEADATPELSQQLCEELEKMKIQDDKATVPDVHDKADMVIAYSTVPGYYSWRQPDLGSWFVRCIVYVFSEMACKEHLMDMLTKVRRLMMSIQKNEKEKWHGDEKYHQISETSERLLKKIYFCPGLQE